MRNNNALASQWNEFTSPAGGQSPTLRLDTQSSQWDWVYMYYCATVLLGMSEQEFWRLTPKKLNALIKQYTCNPGKSNKDAFEQLMQP